MSHKRSCSPVYNWYKFRLSLLVFKGWIKYILVQVMTWPLTSSSEHMMTSSNGSFFRVTGHLCGGIPRTKASDAELWYFLWSNDNVTSYLLYISHLAAIYHRGYHSIGQQRWWQWLPHRLPRWAAKSSRYRRHSSECKTRINGVESVCNNHLMKSHEKHLFQHSATTVSVPVCKSD